MAAAFSGAKQESFFSPLHAKRLGIEITCERIGDQAVGKTVLSIASFHQRIFDQLSVVVSNGLLDNWFPIRVLRGNLIEGNGYPSADGEIGKPGAHGGIAGNDAVENRGITLRENHPFAPAGRTS